MHQEDSLSIHFFTLINYEADQLLTMTLKKRDFLVLISINNNKRYEIYISYLKSNISISFSFILWIYFFISYDSYIIFFIITDNAIIIFNYRYPLLIHTQ